MNIKNSSTGSTGTWSLSQKIAISGIFMAVYVITVYLTQSFSFGAYQIRIATAIYALSWFFPFLILPLGAANCLSNLLFGGLGLPDIIGGFIIGVLTTSLVVLIKKLKLPNWLAGLPVFLVPGFGVPVYLHIILEMPYWVLTASLLVGQLVAGVVGSLLVVSLSKTKVFSGGGN